MEAVVKSLDPNSTASRDAVLDTATEIIRHVAKTYVLPLALPFSLLPTTRANQPLRQLSYRRLPPSNSMSGGRHRRRGLHHV